MKTEKREIDWEMINEGKKANLWKQRFFLLQIMQVNFLSLFFSCSMH